MLVLSRKQNERIRVGESVVVTVVRVSGDKVRIGIEAPPNVRVLRDELDDDRLGPGPRAGGGARPRPRRRGGAGGGRCLQGFWEAGTKQHPQHTAAPSRLAASPIRPAPLPRPAPPRPTR